VNTRDSWLQSPYQRRGLLSGSPRTSCAFPLCFSASRPGSRENARPGHVRTGRDRGRSAAVASVL
jgi:hypothetical protein